MRLSTKASTKAKLQESAAQQDWEKSAKRPVVNRSLARLAEAKGAHEIMKDTFVFQLSSYTQANYKR